MNTEKYVPGRRFPLFVDIKDWLVIVVGGGAVAERRIRTLLSFGPEIRVVSPRVTEEIRRLAEEGALVWEEREAGNEAFTSCGRRIMLLLASSDEELNRILAARGREAGYLVNNASSREDCDFYFPAVAVNGSLVAGISSDGVCHARVREAAAAVREAVGERSPDFLTERSCVGHS